ncbi:MAG: DNA primase [Euryarchaeota archaeon TMED129]|nr:MAG: DNA primase [Euryarchaeota archaeon TMED129]|tara:strand:- start:1863 stop:2855 length:993 start_codon:yes stop_codon:yes gene_type:complete
MDYVDDKYIRLLSTRLEKYKHVKSGLYNFRCPYCGDSQKHKNKARGYFFLKKTEYIFKCHNCGMGRSLSNFLKDNAADLHDEYIMEKYRQGMTGKGRHTPAPEYKGAKPKFANKVTDLTPISELNTTHPAKKYLLDRRIPEDQLGRFFYVDKFKRWVNTQRQTFDNLQNDRSRIIIPLIDKDGNWFGIQGRSMAATSTLRYITVMFEDKLKLFGQDQVNPEETVYVTEGPFDSTFIKQSVAMCGSDVDHRTLPYPHRVWVFDNEPRNRQIVSRIDAAIGSGESVVIWPKSVKEKDINDMVLAGLDPSAIIKSNTFSGLTAKVQLTDWKKV